MTEQCFDCKNAIKCYLAGGRTDCDMNKVGVVCLTCQKIWVVRLVGDDYSRELREGAE